ncbi:MAG: SDR family oxidoreductase [Gammaproteobacteria bacterium]|nr:SDR family oxidoreductase [Gammaproteobacteria bacterium]
MPTRKRVVVAGANSGIGLSACKQFAERGYLVAAGALDPGASALREAAESAPGNLRIVPLDVTDDASVDNAFAEIFDQFGRVDVLVNSAGAGCIGALEECSLAEIEHTMAVNFFGVVRATKAVLPRMREAGSGRLIAVSSLGGLLGQPFQDAYCASKFALEGLYESLRPLAAQFGVHVSLVEPGPVDTGFRSSSRGFDRAAEGTANDAYVSLRAQYDALMAAGEGREQSPEDAAACLVAVAEKADPSLRYQTSRFATKLAAIKMADLDGSAVNDFAADWFT